MSATMDFTTMEAVALLVTRVVRLAQVPPTQSVYPVQADPLLWMELL